MPENTCLRGDATVPSGEGVRVIVTVYDHGEGGA
ncbi:hypothetical protein SUDANB180_06242 [Streptomyces sp. enrichment culture]